MILALDKFGKLTTARGQRPAYRRRTAGTMNDTELAYFHYLQLLCKLNVVFAHSGFEPETLRFGARRYTPDFKVIMPDMSVKLMDVKGCRLTKVRRIPRPWIEPQDRLRIEMFACAFPRYRFVLTWQHAGQWFEEGITP